jgi:hypothetical protein
LGFKGKIKLDRLLTRTYSLDPTRYNHKESTPFKGINLAHYIELLTGKTLQDIEAFLTKYFSIN